MTTSSEHVAAKGGAHKKPRAKSNSGDAVDHRIVKQHKRSHRKPQTQSKGFLARCRQFLFSSKPTVEKSDKMKAAPKKRIRRQAERHPDDAAADAFHQSCNEMASVIELPMDAVNPYKPGVKSKDAVRDSRARTQHHKSRSANVAAKDFYVSPRMKAAPLAAIRPRFESLDPDYSLGVAYLLDSQRGANPLERVPLHSALYHNDSLSSSDASDDSNHDRAAYDLVSPLTLYRPRQGQRVLQRARSKGHRGPMVAKNYFDDGCSVFTELIEIHEFDAVPSGGADSSQDE